MQEIKIRRTEKIGENSAETIFEAKELDYVNESLIQTLFGKAINKPEEADVKIVTEPKAVQPGVEGNVVAIYDNAGIPSFMYRFKRVSDKELFGGSDKPHPAFVIGGEVYDEIYISVYQNCEINRKPYSLPYQKPWTNIDNDAAADACFSKGEGWHLMTAAEWGLIVNLCSKNGVFPHGNTNCGKWHGDENEKGVTYGDGGKTLTGSGPETWTHDHTSEGVHDLCGNVWEMLRGARMKDGVLEVAKDNDAALDIDLTFAGDDWTAVLADNGKPVRVSVDDGIMFTTDEDIEHDYTGDCWEDVDVDCISEQLTELGLYAGEPKTYCYMDSTDGEYFPIRGGRWDYGAHAGVFYSDFADARADAYSTVGFRSAYYKKRN